MMSTSYLRRHWLIPVLQNFRQRFFGLSVSDHGIVWFDIWSKCKLYCVPSLRPIIAGWDILFSVFWFPIYVLKAWFLVEKVGFLVIIFSARKWRERKILHHLPKTPCRKAAFKWPSLRFAYTSFWASYAPGCGLFTGSKGGVNIQLDFKKWNKILMIAWSSHVVFSFVKYIKWKIQPIWEAYWKQTLHWNKFSQ